MNKAEDSIKQQNQTKHNKTKRVLPPKDKQNQTNQIKQNQPKSSDYESVFYEWNRQWSKTDLSRNRVNRIKINLKQN